MGISAALKMIATCCALTGENLLDAKEIDSGIKTHARRSTKYDKPEAKADREAARAILAPTPMNDVKGTPEAIKNQLVYLVAAYGVHGVFRDRYVAAIGMLGYSTLATRLATAEILPPKTRAVRVTQDGDKLIVAAPYNYKLNAAVVGKGWTFFGSPDNNKVRFQKPYQASTGELHSNVRVVDASKLAEVQQVLAQCFAGRPVIIEEKDQIRFDVL